jgi:hypothetical protein
MNKQGEKETLTKDMDILDSIGSDICEAFRDLIYNIKEIKKDIANMKKL